jgi:hypothetical protein
MPSSWMWRRVNLVRTDVSEERVTSIFRVEKYNRVFSTMKMEVTHSSGTLVLPRSTRRNIPEDGILHSHLPGNLKFCVCTSICVRMYTCMCVQWRELIDTCISEWVRKIECGRVNE